MEKKFILLTLVLFYFFQVNGMDYFYRTVDSLSVYPNPATTSITIDFYSDESAEPKLRIIDLTGKTVLKSDNKFTSVPGKFQAEISIDDLSTGIYFVKVIQGEAILTRRLVVK